MSELHCVYCTRPLTGGLDTYGLAGEEQCFDCYLTPEAEIDVFEEECLETIRLAQIALDQSEESEDHYEFMKCELFNAYRLLEDHRAANNRRMEQWRESMGAS